MLALTAARVFDGHHLVDIPTVLIDDGRIFAVGTEIPNGADVVDLGDATILPGLVDCHQHLVFNGVGTLEEQVAGLRDADLLARARANALTALRSGVTTIRDLGDRNFVTLALRDDPELPTILCAGPPITVVQGHCWYLGGECEPEHLERAVAERAERGCAVVKVMVSGGHLTPTFPMHQSQFGADELGAIVAAAHARNLPVAAHCHGIDSIINAIEVGVDTIEHCTFMDENLDSHPNTDLLDRIRAADITVSGTLGALPGFEPPPVIKRNLSVMLSAWGDFHRTGGRVVVGTDAGIAPGKPHDIAPHALTHLLEMDVSRADALKAMTVDGAAAIGLGDHKGALASGYDADILAVAGDPLTDGDLLAAVGVWLRGTRVVG